MILPRLSGPHVPRFVAAGDFEGPYIVMELVEGTSLKARLDRPAVALRRGRRDRRAASPPRCTTSTASTSSISTSSRATSSCAPTTAVLIDFGLSRHAQLPDLPAEEIAGPIGTGAYIAPEQARACATIRAAICSRSASFSISSPPASGRSASRRRVREWRQRLYVRSAAAAQHPAGHPALAAGNHPALPRASIRNSAIRPRRSSPSICSIRNRSR